MLTKVKYFTCPENIKDTIMILKKGKGDYSVFAGGTSIALNRISNITGLVSLKKLKLDHITQNKNSIKIGAMTKIQDILENKNSKKFAKGLLYKSCYCIGSTLNRNLITLGGNIVQIYKWSDLPVSLLVLDTKVKIHGIKTKNMKFTDFLKKHPKNILKYTDIVTEIEIKNPKIPYGTEFITFSKTEFDYAICDTAVYISVINKKCKEIRLAYGGVLPLPFRAYKLEAMMKNKIINDDLINKVSDEAEKIINPTSDIRVSKTYKKHLIKVLTKQAIKSAVRSCR